MAQVVQHVARPRTRLLPPVSNACRSAAGLPGSVLVGDERVEDELRGEARLRLLLGVEPGGVEQLADELAAEQVLLRQQEVQRVLGEGGVGEALVAGRRATPGPAWLAPTARAAAARTADSMPIASREFAATAPAGFLERDAGGDQGRRNETGSASTIGSSAMPSSIEHGTAEGLGI